MLTPTQVSLDADLIESLRQVAAEKGATLDQVLGESARDYLRQARREKIHREQEAYLAMHAELKQKYLGQHVAIHEGKLVDVDADAGVLLRRVRRQFGRAPVMICEVSEQPIPEFVIRSPRLKVISAYGQ